MAKKRDNGFVKISRNILEWEWYQDVVSRCLFIHCILRASWKNKTWKGIEIKRGQFITSLSNLAKEIGFSIQQTRTALDRLLLTGELTNLSTPKYRIITVNNYDKYQAVTKQPTNSQQSTNKQINKQPTTIKERKKNTSYSKEEKKEGGAAATPLSGVNPDYDPPPGVDPTWDYYKQRGGY